MNSKYELPDPTNSSPCCSQPDCCGEVSVGLTRRNFIGTLTFAATGSFFLPRLVMAGPFDPGDFQNLVPADKKLAKEWVKSLFERGTPTIYRGSDLKFIGMPVGGLCAGQLYLGGDGQLWHWDIFNNPIETGSSHYQNPLTPEDSVDQGFALRIVSGAKEEIRALNARGFPGVTFCGEYPIGTVTYADPAFPLEVRLEAFSPFLPLDVDNSSLPATVMKFTVKNTSSTPIEAELGGWLQNVIAHKSGQLFPVVRTNRTAQIDGAILLECGFREWPSAGDHQDRPAIVFDDFEREDWGKWKVEGNAFGNGPKEGPAGKQQLKEYEGKRTANSYAGRGDGGTGKLTSDPFPIERRFINFLIGGGNHIRPNGQLEAGIQLLLEGNVVRNATGSNSDTMSLASWDVSEFAGKTAALEIIDNIGGGVGPHRNRPH